VTTIAMGVFGRLPIALATGLGLDAFLAVAVASRMSWADAMGLIVLEGLIITLLVLTGFRIAVFRAIPGQLKTAIAVGIGLFLALIGLVDAGIVRRPQAGTVPVQLGADGSLRGWPVLVFVLGLAIMAILVARRVRGAILLGILAGTVIALIVNAVAHPGPAVNANGIGAGFVSYVMLQVARGRARTIHPLLWVVAGLFVLYFALEPLEALLGIA
jgi:adenine/guanine/hypoxanthine permease